MQMSFLLRFAHVKEISLPDITVCWAEIDRISWWTRLWVATRLSSCPLLMPRMEWFDQWWLTGCRRHVTKVYGYSNNFGELKIFTPSLRIYILFLTINFIKLLKIKCYIYFCTRNKNILHITQKKLFHYFILAWFNRNNFYLLIIFRYVRIIPSVIFLAKNHRFLHVSVNLSIHLRVLW